MSFLRLFSVCLAATMVLGTPRYVAIPLEDFESAGFVAEPLYENPSARDIEMESQASEFEPRGSYVEAPSRLIADEDRSKRHSGGHGDIVDYGAYTGHKGAFGWYTDHPVGGYH